MNEIWLDKQFNRFLWTGIFNTINGYAWNLGFQLLTGKPMMSNMPGYGVAALIGYVAHSRFTFRQRPSLRSAATYSVVITTCYGVNLVVLKWSLSILPAIASQMLAISVFVVLSYFGQSRFAFVYTGATPLDRDSEVIDRHDRVRSQSR